MWVVLERSSQQVVCVAKSDIEEKNEILIVEMFQLVIHRPTLWVGWMSRKKAYHPRLGLVAMNNNPCQISVSIPRKIILQSFEGGIVFCLTPLDCSSYTKNIYEVHTKCNHYPALPTCYIGKFYGSLCLHGIYSSTPSSILYRVHTHNTSIRRPIGRPDYYYLLLQ